MKTSCMPCGAARGWTECGELTVFGALGIKEVFLVSVSFWARFLKEDEVVFQSTTRQDHEKVLWKKIWSLECPNKMRNLMWRASRNSLPSKCNLMSRRIITDQMCDRCKDENEDIMHAVWGCKGLDGVWGADSTWSFRNQRSFSSFSELLSWIFKLHKNPVLFAFIVWSIWHQRNQIRTQQSHRLLNLLFQWAHDNYLEYKALKIALVPYRTVRRVRWKPPDPGSYKINFNGATFVEENCSGLGVIV